MEFCKKCGRPIFKFEQGFNYTGNFCEGHPLTAEEILQKIGNFKPINKMNETYTDLEKRPLSGSFGQQLVGVNFNPSGDTTVNDVKQTYADIIDAVFEDDVVGGDENGMAILEDNNIRQFYRDTVIQKIMEAQMWTVKYLTAK